jgi:hypothetical protein
MKFTLLLLFLLSPIASALDVWEFSLCGLDKQSTLVCISPDGHEDADTFVKDSQGNYTIIKINALIDKKSRTVLRKCIWDKSNAMFECQGNNNINVPIKYTGKPITQVSRTLRITEPIEARRIQKALEKLDTCHSGEAFFSCQENCPSNVPRNLLLVYCGD